MRRRNPDMQGAVKTAKDNAGLIAVAAGVGLIGLLAFRRSAQAATSGDNGGDAGGSGDTYGDAGGSTDLPPSVPGGGTSGADQPPAEYEVDRAGLLEQEIAKLPGELQEIVRALVGRNTSVGGVSVRVESLTAFATGLAQLLEGITLPPDTTCAVVGLDAMQRPSNSSGVRALQTSLNQLFSALAEEQRRLRIQLETSVVAGGGPSAPSSTAAALADGRAAGQTERGQTLRAALATANLICGTEYFVRPQNVNPDFPTTIGNLLGRVEIPGRSPALASGIRPLASVGNPRCGFTPEFLANPNVRVVAASERDGQRVRILTNNLPEPSGTFQLAVDGVYGPCTQRAQYIVYFLACHAGLPEIAQGFTGVDPRSGTADRSALNPTGALTGVQSNRAALQSMLVTLAKQWQRMGIVKVGYDGPG